MHESESYKQSQPLGEPSRRDIFTRFFKKHALELNPTTDNVQESDSINKQFEIPFREDGKPDHFHPTKPMLEEAEIREILNGIGIEKGPDHLHVIHYMGGNELDSYVDASQSFSDYVKEHDLSDPRPVVSLYSGDLTREDNSIIKKLLGYNGRDMTDQDRKAEIGRLSQSARELMEETIIPEHLSFNDALKLIQKDQLTPVAYYYSMGQFQDLKESEKVFFWIDDTFGGDITINIGPMFNDSLAGPTAEGEVLVNLRGKLAGKLYWNTWHSNAVRWTVDPFLRSTILDEDPENQIYTQL